LEVPRSEVEAYCDEQGLQPRFDRSNLDTTYFRNWLRHEVLPLLAQHNPNIREVIRRSARVIADDYALLRSLLEEAWPDVVAEEAASGYVVFCLDAWRALPVALQRATLREAVHRLRRSLRNINFVHIEDALPVARDGATGNRATLPGHLMLTVGYERLTIADADRELVPIPPEWPLLAASVDRLAVAVPGRTPLPDSSWLLEAALRMRENLPGDWEANRDPWRAFLDADRAGSDLWLRTRRPGDRFAPLGMRGRTVKLADFLTNQKVPRALRDRLPILEGPEGIVWVCGQRISDVVRIQAGTEQILELRFVKAG
jgi:tRNA(Ile)-lysidine synthase